MRERKVPTDGMPVAAHLRAVDAHVRRQRQLENEVEALKKRNRELSEELGRLNLELEATRNGGVREGS
ncbi:putative nucleic acid-binding Zn-ribbon protein [Desulfobaculum xiamenense]|uniref:Putative nucleic acid-binding Zn-ribbon protein n=1 Tax=Desulfobaculum xiamenense TaxID=995050 RepID=A0A846QGV6_9BACT|nr:hypothetical protein [Desulfobaculum xiamenense]NJB67518.1 putative nucleic acid-binding Zn-ribbon protein [Desulfobaculum xiamenense]